MHMLETKIHIIRHGETEWNSQQRWQGHTDIELSQTGHLQAQKLLAKWSNKLSAVYSSDLSRAEQTAKYVAEAQGLPVVSEPGLREIYFGKWEGKTTTELRAEWGEILDVFFESPDRCHPPNGETFPQLYERSVAVYKKIVSNHQGEEIAIFAHGGTIRMLLCYILSLPISQAWNLRQDNTCVNTAAHILTPSGKERIVLERLNDVSHLLY